MSYEFYKVLHLVFALTFFVFVGVNYISLSKGLESSKKAGMIQGIALLVMFVAGFGLLARVGVSWPWPGWVWAKVVIWLALGGSSAIVKRRLLSANVYLWLMLALAALVVILAIVKPF